jgi:hypothetical protein
MAEKIRTISCNLKNVRSAYGKVTPIPDNDRQCGGAARWCLKDDTIGLWSGDVAAIAFTKSKDAYLAGRDERAIEAFVKEMNLTRDETL